MPNVEFMYDKELLEIARFLVMLLSARPVVVLFAPLIMLFPAVSPNKKFCRNLSI